MNREVIEKYCIIELVIMITVSFILAYSATSISNAATLGNKSSSNDLCEFQKLSSPKCGAVMLDNIEMYKYSSDSSPKVDKSFYLQVSKLKKSNNIAYGKRLKILAESKNWLYVKSDNKKGYIRNYGFVKFNPKKKQIALTFDDGPSLETTPIVLRALKKNKCRGTFFVLGNRINKRTGKLLTEAQNLGCEIGNHSFSHGYMVAMSKKRIRREFKTTDILIKRYTGTTPKLIRPPYGAINKKLRKNAKKPLVLWTVDTMDWKFRSSKRLKRYVRKHRRPGSVILMHDIHRSTAVSIDKICKSLNKKGYETVTVSELAAIKGKKLISGGVYVRIK